MGDISVGQALVNCALDTAVKNGYGSDLDEWDSSQIADDLASCHESFEGPEPSSVWVPYIEVWKEERRIRASELGDGG